MSKAFSFEILASEGNARVGRLITPHGVIETPVFMPVGTQGTVKAMIHRLLEEIGVQVILSNTYHLYLRPGVEVIELAGGLHSFIGWQKPILTDSGGFQVFSLSRRRTKDNRSGVRVLEEGVEFRDHLSGSLHFFTPEKVIDMQEVFGSDFIMPLDECVEYPTTYTYAQASVERTLRWLDRSIKHKKREDQALFGIVQGAFFEDLRRYSAMATVERDLFGYAIGGLSVGEPKEIMYAMVEVVCEYLPWQKPRYLMGVGMPEDLVECVARGIDMFDCVAPTRMARTGTLFTSQGKINITNEIYKKDFSPVDEECNCYTCRNFTKAYLRHLYKADEISAYILGTVHNLSFYHKLMKDIRTAIKEGRFESLRRSWTV
ncbi:queuine tRNA-ribosyltransferase [Hydrogenobacter thermophilus TK-6]|uniref:Queuine tRNA-ribosyltransferase n=1 Tax=Hydrogenobacter thermophilus (strain DSM 6534 / IAM 12695 / TK-6) TaxID=608538 RepID=D3DIV0_HYDTT|nr:tRNA guanosine(34) transglycosylase Tgt [Hydrogenobacter thermophilus]ADO45679.1 queuine tRNA-ribosyltransferase [Hydrogenobacter thermophilus TK-6]BAI69752.1 queuine tRNA-ribosyltransferase [Hydrogenobacter thermophilus TK-6]